MILLDTDHFSVLVDNRHARHGPLIARLGTVDEIIAVPVVSIEEQLRAWLAQIHRIRDAHRLVQPYDRLVQLLEVLADWNVARWTDAVADEFASLQNGRIRIGTQDLRIAAIALASDALLLSANLRDFEKVPQLRVEDWLYT